MTDVSLNRTARLTLVAAAALLAAVVGWRATRPVPPPPVTAGNVNPADEIVTRLERRLASQPGDVEGWRMLGSARTQSGRFADAATAYRRLVALAPTDADAWSSLGGALMMDSVGNTMPPEADAAFAKALAIDPKDPRARYFSAAGKDMRGDHGGAVTAWLALLADSPRGVPWEESVRRALTGVATANHIDITARLAAAEATRCAATVTGA